MRTHTRPHFFRPLACTVGAASILATAGVINAQEILNPSNTQVPLGGEEHEHGDGTPDLVFEPRAHLRAVYGHTDIEDAGLAHGGHDPAHNGFSVPSLSLGMDVVYGEYFAGFAEGILSWTNDGGWDAELEELYANFLNLPGGFEIHVGRFLASVGTQNDVHNHGWNFVDAQLDTVRFLGDDGLVLEGVEISWSPPTRWDDRFTISFGDTVNHEHEEEHGDEEDEDEHGHSEEAEEALWDRDVLTLRYKAILWPGDNHKFIYGASYVQGKNFMGKRARLYGADLTYTWLEDEDHGKQLIWRNEVMLRKIATDEGRFEELAFSSSAIYKFNPQWEIGLRYDYLEGVEDPELPERHRVSPALTRYFQIGDVDAMARLQYNYDHSEERGDDHSIWFQFGLEWGAGGGAHVH